MKAIEQNMTPFKGMIELKQTLIESGNNNNTDVKNSLYRCS